MGGRRPNGFRQNIFDNGRIDRLAAESTDRSTASEKPNQILFSTSLRGVRRHVPSYRRFPCLGPKPDSVSSPVAFQRLSQRQLLGGLIILLLIVVVVVTIGLTRSGNGGGAEADPALAKTAARVLPLLNNPSHLLPIDDTSLRSFQAWFYDLKAPFQKAVKLVPSDQFIEVTVADPNAFPPQAPTLTMPGQPTIYADAAAAQEMKQSGRPVYTTVNAGGRSYRMYLEALRVPEILRSVGMTGTLLVIRQN